MEVLKRSDLQEFSKVRLVGTQLSEIVTSQEAWQRAEDLGLDLVLVSKDVSPPVVKIQDQKKIEYEKKKARQKPKKSELKEVRFMANISDHDLETKLKSISKFLEQGNKVKVSVRLKGRERENPQRAQVLIDRVAENITCKITRVKGPIVSAILEPVAK